MVQVMVQEHCTNFFTHPSKKPNMYKKIIFITISPKSLTHEIEKTQLSLSLRFPQVFREINTFGRFVLLPTPEPAFSGYAISFV